MWYGMRVRGVIVYVNRMVRILFISYLGMRGKQRVGAMGDGTRRGM